MTEDGAEKGGGRKPLPPAEKPDPPQPEHQKILFTILPLISAPQQGRKPKITLYSNTKKIKSRKVRIRFFLRAHEADTNAAWIFPILGPAEIVLSDFP